MIFCLVVFLDRELCCRVKYDNESEDVSNLYPGESLTYAEGSALTHQMIRFIPRFVVVFFISHPYKQEPA